MLLVVLVLLNDDSTKLVNGQLEAVGAVLSVVPVTSILATAGLVGVKLAALSRLLKVLGYDQAYLANVGGHGTAAAPIGLQTNYAYMFPYVPGLNISVKGESGTNFENLAAHQRDAALYSATTRKTFPAMGLPGDYENQNRPFRGSETLREIFRDSGVQMRFPTFQQQQQQNINGAFPKGNGNSNSIVDPTGSNVDFDNVQPSATTPIYHTPNENVNKILDDIQKPPQLPPKPPQQPPQLQLSPQQSNIPQHSNHPAPVAVVPSSSSTSLNLPVQPKHPDDLGWPQQPPANRNNEQAANQQPSSSNIRVPGQPDQPQQQAPPTLPANHPQQHQAHSSSSHQSNQISQVSRLSIDPNHLIPQHEYYRQKILDESRSRPIKPEPLPSGSLIRIPSGVTPMTFEDFDHFSNLGMEHTPSAPINRNTMNGDGSGLVSGELTTNIVPLPYLTEGPPPFHDDMNHNEFLLVNRRKRRDVSSISSAPGPAKTGLGAKIFEASGHRSVEPSSDTFGMPAVNINPMRRRKRSLAMKILSASNLQHRVW